MPGWTRPTTAGAADVVLSPRSSRLQRWYSYSNGGGPSDGHSRPHSLHGYYGTVSVSLSSPHGIHLCYLFIYLLGLLLRRELLRSRRRRRRLSLARSRCGVSDALRHGFESSAHRHSNESENVVLKKWNISNRVLL